MPRRGVTGSECPEENGEKWEVRLSEREKERENEGDREMEVELELEVR